MPLFDHVILLTQDLPGWETALCKEGFRVSDRDGHREGAVQHRFLGLAGGSYLEVLDLPAGDPVAEANRLFEAAAAGVGFGDWALRVSSLDAAVEAVAALGHAPTTVRDVEGTVGGVLWRLRLARFAKGLPFLIEDVARGELRNPFAGEPHPNGVAVLAGLVVATESPRELARFAAAAVGAPPAAVTEQGEAVDLAWAGQTLRLCAGAGGLLEAVLAPAPGAWSQSAGGVVVGPAALRLRLLP